MILLLFAATLTSCQDVPSDYDCMMRLAAPRIGRHCDGSPVCGCTECLNVSNPSVVWCAPYFSLNESKLPVDTNWTCAPVTQDKYDSCVASGRIFGWVIGVLVCLIVCCGCFYIVVDKVRGESTNKTNYTQV